MKLLEKKETIKKLEDLADEVKELKNSFGQRRPILIEICGTPKSGKSTSITSLNIFLKRNKFKTEIVTEMAAVCPVSNKSHPLFNSWTLFTSLAETIKVLSTARNKVDIIIVDRAIFDALCWFEWLNTNPSKQATYLDDTTYLNFRKLFMETYMWYSLFDLTIVYTAKPTISLQREYAMLLTEKTGSIMNEPVLKSFNNAIKTCIKKYKNYFPKIAEIETSSKDPDQVGLEITQKVLHCLKEILVERIGYFEPTVFQKLKPGIDS
jgi:hypothetical protein